MKNKLFSVLLGLTMLLVLLGSVAYVEAEADIPVAAKPLPAELADVAEPYVDPSHVDWKDVQILLSLPEIQINSADADAVNNEIAELEQWIVEDYQMTYATWEADRANFPEYDFYYNTIAYYTARVVQDILSVEIKFMGNLGQESEESLIYNFDLTSGSLLSDEALVNRLTGQNLNFDLLWEENVVREAKTMASIVEAWAQAYATQEDPYADTNQQKPIIGYADQLTAQSLAMSRAIRGKFSFNEEKELTSSVLSLASNGSLKMHYVQATPAGGGYYYTEAPFYPYAYPTERELNPIYAEIMEELGLDAKASPYNGLLAFVGADTGEAAALEPVLSRVSAFSARWNGYNSPSPVLSITIGEETNWQEVSTFSEFYLVVPKYQNDFIEMTEVELTDDGQLVAKNEGTIYETFIDFWSGQAMGVGLIGISTETMPTGVLHFSNIYERGEMWYPSFSGKDGSLILPEDILDITDLVENNFQSFDRESLYIDEDLATYISWNWPKG
ncbi:MAG: hypothetical protein Q4E09_05060 [Eubacteriales bacterium]|nr:hypothetical protein [Eubacteriales bacterium]